MKENNNWNKLSKKYVAWVSNTQFKNFIHKNFKWHGLSLWWICNLTQKDNVNNQDWYNLLYKKIYEKKGGKYLIKKRNRLLNLLKDIISKILVSYFFRKKVKIQKKRKIIFFHSVDTNFKLNGEFLVDRLYMSTPLIDQDFGFDSHYIIDVNIAIKNIFQLIFYKKKYENLGRNYHILNSYIKISDIFNVYLYLFINHIKYLLLIIKNKNKFIIDDIDCSAILEPYFRESFYTMHSAMCKALAFNNFFKQFDEPQIIITTSEFMPNVRGIYYHLHKDLIKHEVITIQHALSSENKLFCCHSASEFDFVGLGDGVQTTPMPDRYLVQGIQFYDILSQYYSKKRIDIIGCLKYDSITKYDSQIKKNEIKNILIAPSIGDEESIIEIINEIKDIKKWDIVISPHPNNIENTYNKFSNQLHHFKDIEFNIEKSTLSLIKESDLVLCGHSGVAIDSIILGVPSARVYSEKLPTMIDFKDNIRAFKSGAELERWIISLSDKSFDDVNYLSTISNLFYKIDGSAGRRLWNAILNKANNEKKY